MPTRNERQRDHLRVVGWRWVNALSGSSNNTTISPFNESSSP